MSAKHALLGLLLEKPAYPYQLGDRLQKYLGPTWKINSGQVSQAIKQMEKEKLIKRIDGARDSQDERHLFEITADGVEEFERWLEQDTSKTRQLRRPWLVKTMFAGPERLESAVKEIEAYEYECAARLDALSRELKEIPVAGLQVRADDELRRSALRGEVYHVDGELQLARYMRDRVIWLKNHSDVVWPSTRTRLPAKKTRDRQRTREELFGRIAERGRRSVVHGEPGQDDDG